jgi:hypothetical protein
MDDRGASRGFIHETAETDPPGMYRTAVLRSCTGVPFESMLWINPIERMRHHFLAALRET